MKNLLIIGLLFIATGCAVFQNPKENLPTVVITSETEYLVPEVDISQELLAPCKPLETLPQESSFEGVLANTANNTLLYSECSAKQASLANIVKKSLNIKETK